MQVEIHGKKYSIQNGEFDKLTHPYINPLTFVTNVGYFDREIALINKLASDLSLFTLIDCGTTHGGYIPLNTNKVKDVYILQPNKEKQKLVNKNASESTSVFGSNMHYHSDIQETYDSIRNPEKVIVRVDAFSNFNRLENEYAIVISNSEIPHLHYTSVKFGNRVINVKTSIWKPFKTVFQNYLKIHDDSYILTYDNLINVLIMVKNAGEGFREVLKQNVPFMDRFTILDTGSTDNTLQIIKEELKGVDGNVYQEPFINFRDSRNRLFDLAGEDCVYNVVIDDTYILRGDLRNFLTIARGCDVGKAYNLSIKSVDVQYGSCRITRSSEKFRYKYRVHEIIDSREHPNYKISDGIASIYDVPSLYMSDRTNFRKEQDLVWLFEDLQNSPNDPRIPYYIAETYLCMGNFEEAYKYYEIRSKLAGYTEEKQDSYYKMAVLSEEQLGKDWETCLSMYLNCYNFDPKRCESMFMIGSHYFQNHQTKYLGYYFLKEAFKIGDPDKSYGMNLKVDIYNFHLPSRLLEVAYLFKDYETAIQCCKKILSQKNDRVYHNWLTILNSLHQNVMYTEMAKQNNPHSNTAKLLCFITDGGWKAWDGEVFEKEGLGGSETSMIKYAEYISKNHSDKYTCVVFCPCEKLKTYNGVIYSPIKDYIRFVSEYHHIALVNRYTEYAPMCIANNVPTFIILHDLTRDSEIIIDSFYLKGILTLSDWHSDVVKRTYPTLAYKVGKFHYGIDFDEFALVPNSNGKLSLASLRSQECDTRKIPRSFIYSSFPNRGLLNLLRVFPKIIERYSDAKLNVYCDLNNHWVNQVSPIEMTEVKRLMDTFDKRNVVNHGWVNGATLKKAWSQADVWLYPCIFAETCCLTALEAAASKTLIVTNNYAALNETVGDRGIVIPGDPNEEGWNVMMLKLLFNYFDGVDTCVREKERGMSYVIGRTYDIVVEEFLGLLDSTAIGREMG